METASSLELVARQRELEQAQAAFEAEQQRAAALEREHTSLIRTIENTRTEIANGEAFLNDARTRLTNISDFFANAFGSAPEAANGNLDRSAQSIVALESIISRGPALLESKRAMLKTTTAEFAAFCKKHKIPNS